MADLSHRIWNDAKLAINAIPELYEALCCSLHILNLHMGPFDSYAWWQQAKEAAQGDHSVGSFEDPLWQSRLPAILRGR
eukprot:10574728-Lingulodinium_polyedra.AAC.1